MGRSATVGAKMLDRSLLLPLAALVAACSGAPGGRAEAPKTGDLGPLPVTPWPGPSRFFHAVAEDCFWVAHTDALDRVVCTGSRMELATTGEVLASAWEDDRITGDDPLVGGLAVKPELGGGFYFWTQYRVFRAETFTGSLTPIGLGSRAEPGPSIRGLRHGFGGVVAVTEDGPRLIKKTANVALPFPIAGVSDFGAIDDTRGLRIDVFGRPGSTGDTGKSWFEAPLVGMQARTISVGAGEMWFETWQGKAALQADGTVAEPDGNSRTGADYQRPFQMVYRGSRADRDDSSWYGGGYRDMQPIQSAIQGGGLLPDGTAIALLRGVAARVDLTTGKTTQLMPDWLPVGIACSVLPAPPPDPGSDRSPILFACTTDDYRGYGAYVLRTDQGEPPHVERGFSDDGAFIANDDGAIGYTGSCQSKERFIDPDRYYRGGPYDEDPAPAAPLPTFCVRRTADEWVEHRIDLDPAVQLLSWIPKRDGTAIALVTTANERSGLPPTADDAHRVSAESGVRIVRVPQDTSGWLWGSPPTRGYYRGGYQASSVDRRFFVHEDGTIQAWLGWRDPEDRYGQPSKWTGVTIREGREIERTELPATPMAMATGGAFGLLVDAQGNLYETTNMGRSWARAGVVPTTPYIFGGTCSRLGCSFPTMARLGWGAPKVVPVVDREKRPEVPKPVAKLPRIVCEPDGAPIPQETYESSVANVLGSQAKITLNTTYGAVVEVIRETAEPEANPYSPYGPYGRHYYPPPPVPVPSATPSASAKAKSSAPARTHTLVFRPPLEPLAPRVRLNATNASISSYRRPTAVPLLNANGEVSLLVPGDSQEALVDRNDITMVPSFESRRYAYYYYSDASSLSPGLRLAQNRALVLGDLRRRGSIEEHGPAPQKPSYYFQVDRDGQRRKPFSLARREDGALGVVAIDGPADTVGIAPFDRANFTLGSLKTLPALSALRTGDDPLCRDGKGYRALLHVDPSAWVTIDDTKLPRTEPAKIGLMLVRWNDQAMCLDAIDLAVSDTRRGDQSSTTSLVIRWAPLPGAKPQPSTATNESGPRSVVGALRSNELTVPLSCRLEKDPP